MKRIFAIFLTLLLATPVWALPPTPPLPDQTGNSGKYLTTDGVASSWGAAVGQPLDTFLTNIAGLTPTTGCILLGGATDTASCYAMSTENGWLLKSVASGSPSWTKAIAPATIGTIDNMTIGSITPAAGTFTTLGAGATGFSVDADGDVIGKSFSTTRQASDSTPLTKAQCIELYEDIDDGDNKTTLCPGNLSVSNTYRLPVDSPSGSVMQYPAPTDGVSQGVWKQVHSGDASALNLVTTGTIQGGIVISSDADGMDNATMAAAGVRGTLFVATGAGTWTLPTAVAGMSLCLMDSGTAHDLILDVQGTDTMRLKGTEDTAGDGITNATGSTTGDFVCVVAVAANKWSTMGMQGTWTAQ